MVTSAVTPVPQSDLFSYVTRTSPDTGGTVVGGVVVGGVVVGGVVVGGAGGFSVSRFSPTGSPNTTMDWKYSITPESDTSSASH